MEISPLTVALPIDDRARAHAFYVGGLGFAAEGPPGDDGLPEPLQIVVNDGVRLMLIPRGGFGWSVAGQPVAEAGTSECQLSVGFADRAGVDDFVGQVERAGGAVVAAPREEPWGYVANIADPDGHLWLARAD